MTKTSSFLRRTFAVAALSGVAAVASAQSYVSLDFSDNTQFTLSDFVMRNGNAKASTLGSAAWSNAAGSDEASGRINLAVTATQEFSYYYATPITVGSGVVVSYDFLATQFTAGGLSRTGIGLSVINPSIATASADLNLVGSNTAPQSRLIKLASDTTATFETRNTNNYEAVTGVSLAGGSWYRFTATFIPDAVNGTYAITTQLYDFTTDSILASASGDTKASATSTFFSNGEALDIYVGLLAQSQYGGAIAIDNFSIAAIPEPSTYALFAGVGGLLLVLRRRFARQG